MYAKFISTLCTALCQCGTASCELISVCVGSSPVYCHIHPGHLWMPAVVQLTRYPPFLCTLHSLMWRNLSKLPKSILPDHIVCMLPYCLQAKWGLGFPWCSGSWKPTASEPVQVCQGMTYHWPLAGFSVFLFDFPLLKDPPYLLQCMITADESKYLVASFPHSSRSEVILNMRTIWCEAAGGLGGGEAAKLVNHNRTNSEPSYLSLCEPTFARKSMWALWNYLDFCINESYNLIWSSS